MPDTEMPRYQSHKVVHALKIHVISETTQPGNESDGSKYLVPENSRYAPIRVSHEFVRRHQPVAPGYYVVYPDGYTSWSPVTAFEEGYTVVTP